MGVQKSGAGVPSGAIWYQFKCYLLWISLSIPRQDPSLFDANLSTTQLLYHYFFVLVATCLKNERGTINKKRSASVDAVRAASFIRMLTPAKPPPMDPVYMLAPCGFRVISSFLVISTQGACTGREGSIVFLHALWCVAV